MKITDMTDTKPKPYCFVLMLFSQEFDDVYNLGIQISCSQAGVYCERVDKQIFQGTILERIYNQIAKADFIVADMTGRNPNVFYEVGYAHALNKPTILLTQDSKDIPFDLKHFPHIVYERRITALIEELTRRIRWFVENPEAGSHAAQIEIDLYLGQDNLSKVEVVRTVDISRDCSLEIRIENTSGKILQPEDYTIGIIAPETYLFGGGFRGDKIALTEGMNIHMLSNMPRLFPGCSASLRGEFYNLPERGRRDRITFRIFTNAGKRDYPLIIERPTDQMARQRLLARAVSLDSEWADEALRVLVEIWPDDDTRELVRARAENAPQESYRRTAMQLLADNWPDDDTHLLLETYYRNDPNERSRCLALKLLVEKFPGEGTFDLLRATVAEGPTCALRGFAFSLLGGLHSDFGRRLATSNCSGDCSGRALHHLENYLDPLKPIPQSHIQRAAESALVPLTDFDRIFMALKVHLRWDPAEGLEHRHEHKEHGHKNQG